MSIARCIHIACGSERIRFRIKYFGAGDRDLRCALFAETARDQHFSIALEALRCAPLVRRSSEVQGTNNSSKDYWNLYSTEIDSVGDALVMLVCVVLDSTG